MQLDEPSTLSKFLAFAMASMAALVGVVWHMLHGKIDTMKEHQQAMIDQHTNEIDRQRDHIAKIFDKLQAFSERAEQRHLELLRAMHEGLNGKADK